jgi:AAA family ATP:ADP antiporter
MLRRIFQLREGEAGRALRLFAYLFLVVCSYVITKTTRDALFLERYPAARLPWADIATAAGITLVMAAYLRVSRLATLPVLLTITIVATMGVSVGFWALAVHAEPFWMLPTLYVWAGATGVLLPAQVWTLAAHVMTTREARRLYAFVGAGPIAGAIAGGFITRAAATRFGTESLLLITAALLAPCPFFVMSIWRQRSTGDDHHHAPKKTAGAGEALRIIRGSPHLMSVARLIGTSSIVTTIVAWQFRAVAKASIGNTNELAAFFGMFNVYAGVLSLAAQLFLSSRLLKRFGLGPTLLVVPAALAIGSAGMIAAAGLATAVFLKGTDQVLRYSVDRSTVELLYLPVPARSRSQAKAFIDTVVWRTGDAAGALIVLAGVSLAHVTVPELSIVALVVIGAWILAAFTARRTYVDALRASIHEHRLDVERLAEQQAERSTLDVLTGALSSADPAVRRDAIAALSAAGDRSALARVEELAADADRGVRAEALVYLARCGAADPLTRVDALDDVHGEALTSAIAHFLAQPGSSEESAHTIRALLDAAPQETRRQIPELLERMGTPGVNEHLVDYLFDADPLMRLESVSALNRVTQESDEGPVDRELVEVVLDAEIMGHYRSYQLLATRRGSGADMDAAREEMAREVERIFRLVKLLLPNHDLHSAYVGVQSDNHAVHANALEFLDHALPPRLRTSLLPLIDSEVSVEDRIAIAERMLGSTP